MPNTVQVSKNLKCLEYGFYIFLLCIIIPLQIKHELERDLEYDAYLEKFNKTDASVRTYQNRLETFKKSLEGIDQYNKYRTNASALYGLTKYTDLTPQDFLQSHLLPNFPNYQQSVKKRLPNVTDNKKFSGSNSPMKIDWRQKNVVTKVQNQGTCGACWAFAAIEVTESMHAIKTGRLQSFSIQEMIDCARSNDGCNGGDVYLLLDWLKTENITVVTADEYPIKLFDGKCLGTSSRGIKIKDFHCGNFVKSEELIIDLLANYGPVSVAINALPWQNYVSGVIQFHCDGNPLHLNHAVQIVGYDMTAEIPYYIVRNSWGEDFGDNGYLYIAIGGNICGLAEEVCIVEL